MVSIKHHIHLTAAAWALSLVAAVVACNGSDSRSFRVKGHASQVADGERLLLVDTDGLVVDTLVVDDGQFSYEGLADSVRFYSLYLDSNPTNSVEFFAEPGQISVTLAVGTDHSSRSGTIANNALQALAVSLQPHYSKIEQLEHIARTDTALQYDQWALAERIDEVAHEIEDKIKAAAEANIDNELGFMLVCHYLPTTGDAELMRRLVALMPQSFRQRQQVKLLDAEANN